jgi:hypothetical protein
VIITATKKTMVLSKVKVQLNATAPNELIGGHTVYTADGIIDFINGESEVTQDIADKLRANGIIQ